MRVETGSSELSARERRIFDQIEDGRRRGRSIEEVVNNMMMLVDDPQIEIEIERVRSYILDLGRRNQLLRIPGGMESLAYRAMAGEARRHHWYTGPQPNDAVWPSYRRILLEDGLPLEAVDELDEATTKIVAYMAPPDYHDLRKKGLVLGYVQSGKTANFTGVIAKASDAGYRLFIVLSGIHNALRQQTQRRLDAQLVEPTKEHWYALTDETSDFGYIAKGGGVLNSPDVRSLAVVKKNPARLRRLVRWLEGIPEDVRRRCPAVIIDDEADQASPNTASADWDRTTINELLVDLRGLLPTSTYVAYTATPFANIFIDPTDEQDLYPEDFIVNLPRPDAYFGAETLFGRSPLDHGDDPDDGLDAIRRIPDDEAKDLRPPSKASERDAFQPPVTPSLGDAIRWFLLATATRIARGQIGIHSSMLIHTTQYSHVHLRHRERIAAFARDLCPTTEDPSSFNEFEQLWREEHDRVPRPEGTPPVSWNAVAEALPAVCQAVDVVADNYLSEDRLSYSDHDDGRVVIAVGGNTLSRGLTLEGLVVSYFVRSASAYDTLLQMGRWFGYRRGYEDLPRVWMTDELSESFRHLATVEAEIRAEVERYEDEDVTPESYAVRVRTHPKLLITSRLKQQHVKRIHASYAGRRLQTFVFSHRDRDVVQGNLDAARDLVRGALSDGVAPEPRAAGRRLLRAVDVDRIRAFLKAFTFHESHIDMRNDLMLDYIDRRVDRAGELTDWNVGILGSGRRTYDVGGQTIDLGMIDLGLRDSVPLINRAPLKRAGGGAANIKALMSKPDRVFDLDISRSAATSMDEKQLVASRPPGEGLLLLYPISRNSVPMGISLRAGSRMPLQAVGHLVGVALVFPDVPDEWKTSPDEANYVSVELPGVSDHIEEDDIASEALDTEAEYSDNGASPRINHV